LRRPWKAKTAGICLWACVCLWTAGAQAQVDVPGVVFEAVETEVAGFYLQGKRARDRLVVYDFDVVVIGQKRYLPLVRMLGLLDVGFEQDEEKLHFQPDGSAPMVLDTKSRRLRIDVREQDVEMVFAISDVTGKNDIFLPPEVIAGIFSFEINWDDSQYAFLADTDKTLGIWKRQHFPSILGIQTEDVSETLPQLHGTARPRTPNLSLDFLEVRGRVKYRPVDRDLNDTAIVDSLEQTLWGGLAGGNYKLRLSQPYYMYYDSEWTRSDHPGLMVDWGEWRYNTAQAELVAGDSVFGLNDLSFSTLRMTGVRFNGLFGVDGAARRMDASQRGYRSVFAAPQVIEGYAPVGSRAELYVNDRLVDTDEVVSSLPDRPGTGMYRFEAFALSPGSMNTIRIEVTDPDGVVTITERNIMGAAAILPRGGMAFLGAAGTRRELDEWTSEGIFTGGRFFYGVTDNLTLGATMAWQEDFFSPAFVSAINPDDRQYPESSLHGATQFSWRLFDRSFLKGDVAWVDQESEGGGAAQDNMAWTMDWRGFPIKGKDVEVGSYYFRYGPEFFDGRNRNLFDREGYVVNAGMYTFPGWRFSAAGGQAWDNLEGERQETLTVNFQNARVESRVLPATTLSFYYDRLDPDWDEPARDLYTAGLRTRLPYRLSFEGLVSAGDDLRFTQNPDFLTGLRLPGISRFGSERTSLLLRWGLPWRTGSVALSYWDSGYRERASVLYVDRLSWWIPLETRTELGYDIDIEDWFFENRTEVPLGKARRSRLGFQGRYENGDWRVETYVSINEMFSRLGGRTSYVPSRRIRPESRILYGRVFLDINGNGVPDPGEPGIEGITVIFNNQREAVTDKNGIFRFPVSDEFEKARVNLKPRDIPAIYVCTHGVQDAAFKEGRSTRVDFGLSPAHAAGGRVAGADRDGALRYLSGIRVYATHRDTGEIRADSITADDGSYYLENLLPGRYDITIDESSIPAGYRAPFEPAALEVTPSHDPVEHGVEPIQLARSSR